MPPDLFDHLRYPEDLFNLQSQVLALYHTTDPNIVYSGRIYGTYRWKDTGTGTGDGTHYTI